jgi:hypothetical protein
LVIERLYGNNYRFVRSAKSDFSNNLIVYLQPYDAFYRVTLYNPDLTICFASSEFKIASQIYYITACQSPTNISAPSPFYEKNVNVTCNFDNSTKTLTCDFYALDNLDHNVTLYVYKIVKPFGKVLYNSTSIKAVSGSLSVQLQDGFNYEYTVEVHSFFDYLTGFINLFGVLKDPTLLIVLMVPLSLGLVLGMFNPIVGLIAEILLLAGYGAVGVLDITTGIIGFVILILIGIVFLYRREYI